MVKDVSFKPANDAVFRPEVAKANVGDFKSSKVAATENSRVLKSEPATTPDKSLVSRAIGYFFTPFSYLVDPEKVTIDSFITGVIVAMISSGSS